MILVNVNLGNGEELPFVLDTGSPWTFFDTSLEAKLGLRIGTINTWNFGLEKECGVYVAPRFYLGKTLLLKSGAKVATYELKERLKRLDHPVMGILGMDVLSHYCIQLDFVAGTLRFLEDGLANKGSWGRAFPLGDLGNGCPTIDANLVGAEGRSSEIDTGCSYDGWLTRDLFQKWTNHLSAPPENEARSPNGVLAGEFYRDVELNGAATASLSGGDPHLDCAGIGLHLLARHLVTFDFPHRTLFLRRTSVAPLVNTQLQAAAKREGDSALKALMRLKRKGQLPGWSKEDVLATPKVSGRYYPPGIVTFELRKRGEPAEYHYTLTRLSKGEPWTIEKATRTAHGERDIELPTRHKE